MVSTAADIDKMIMDRTSHTGGALHLSESLDNVGLDSMEVVSLIFDIDWKQNRNSIIQENPVSPRLADPIGPECYKKLFSHS